MPYVLHHYISNMICINKLQVPFPTLAQQTFKGKHHCQKVLHINVCVCVCTHARTRKTLCAVYQPASRQPYAPARETCSSAAHDDGRADGIAPREQPWGFSTPVPLSWAAYHFRCNRPETQPTVLLFTNQASVNGA